MKEKILIIAGLLSLAVIISLIIIRPISVQIISPPTEVNLAKLSSTYYLTKLFTRYNLMNMYKPSDPKSLTEVLSATSIRADSIMKTSCWDILHEKYYDVTQKLREELENIETVVKMFRDIYNADVHTALSTIRDIKMKLDYLYDSIKHEPDTSFECYIVLSSAPKIIGEARNIASKLWNQTKTAYEILQRTWELRKVVYVYDVLVKQTKNPEYANELNEIEKLLDEAIKYSFSDPERAEKALSIIEKYWEKISS